MAVLRRSGRKFGPRIGVPNSDAVLKGEGCVVEVDCVLMVHDLSAPVWRRLPGGDHSDNVWRVTTPPPTLQAEVLVTTPTEVTAEAEDTSAWSPDIRILIQAISGSHQT